MDLQKENGNHRADYARLGFVPTETTALYIELTWTPPGGEPPC